MWKREITVDVSLGMLTSTLKIFLNFIKIFIMKYYLNTYYHFWKKLKYLLFGSKRRLDNAQIILLSKF